MRRSTPSIPHDHTMHDANPGMGYLYVEGNIWVWFHSNDGRHRPSDTGSGLDAVCVYRLLSAGPTSCQRIKPKTNRDSMVTKLPAQESIFSLGAPFATLVRM